MLFHHPMMNHAGAARFEPALFNLSDLYAFGSFDFPGYQGTGYVGVRLTFFFEVRLLVPRRCHCLFGAALPAPAVPGTACATRASRGVRRSEYGRCHGKVAATGCIRALLTEQPPGASAC